MPAAGLAQSAAPFARARAARTASLAGAAKHAIGKVWSGRWKQNAAPNPLIKNSFLLFVQWDKTVLCTAPSFFGK